MKYYFKFLHLLCRRLLRPTYVTFLKTGCKHKNFITSAIDSTHYIHEIINHDIYHFNVRHPVVFSPQKENLCFGRWTNIFSIFSSFKQQDQTNFRRPKHFTRHTYIHTGTIFFINDLNSIFQRNISNMYLVFIK